jgi:hypothetical protein
MVGFGVLGSTSYPAWRAMRSDEGRESCLQILLVTIHTRILTVIRRNIVSPRRGSLVVTCGFRWKLDVMQSGCRGRACVVYITAVGYTAW